MDFRKELKRIKKDMLTKNHQKPKKSIVYEYNSSHIDSCLCTDSQNRFKNLYFSEHEAERRAKYLFDEQGVYILVYPCPYRVGWHLTRR